MAGATSKFVVEVKTLNGNNRPIVWQKQAAHARWVAAEEEPRTSESGVTCKATIEALSCLDRPWPYLVLGECRVVHRYALPHLVWKRRQCIYRRVAASCFKIGNVESVWQLEDPMVE